MFLRSFFLLLLLCAAAPGYAQTPPAWLGARTVGSAGTFLTASVKSAVDATGNVYHAGSFLGNVMVGGTALSSLGGQDGYLAKFAPDGTLLWLQQLGSAGDEAVRDLSLDAAGNAYLSGNFTSSLTLSPSVSLPGNGARSTFLVRYSSLGVAQWAQQGTGPGLNNGTGVRADQTGHVYLAGHFSASFTFGTTTITDTGSFPAYLARFDAATGALQLLVKTYTFPAGGGVVAAPDLLLTPSGAVYLLAGFYQNPTFAPGTTFTSRGSSDVLVARYSAQGDFEWAQQLGGAGPDAVAGGVLDAADNLYLVGSFTGPATAGTQSFPGAGGFDGYLAKFSAQGTLQWLQSQGGAGNDAWNAVALDAANYPYVTGYFTGSTQVGTRILSNTNGSADIAVAAYTPQGQVRWATQAGGSNFDFGTLLHLNPSGEPLVFGYYGGPCAFGPYTLVPTATQESFVARLGSTVVLSTRPVVAAQPLALYPNPATDQLYLPALPAGTPVQFVDALGRVAREALVTAGAVSVRGLLAGLYQVRATDAQSRRYAGRVLVE